MLLFSKGSVAIMSDNVKVGDVVAICIDRKVTLNILRESLARGERLTRLDLLESRQDRYKEVLKINGNPQLVDYNILNSLLDDVTTGCITYVAASSADCYCRVRHPMSFGKSDEYEYPLSKIITVNDIEEIIKGEYKKEVGRVRRAIDEIIASDESNPYFLRILAKMIENIPYDTY